MENHGFMLVPCRLLRGLRDPISASSGGAEEERDLTMGNSSSFSQPLSEGREVENRDQYGVM